MKNIRQLKSLLSAETVTGIGAGLLLGAIVIATLRPHVIAPEAALTPALAEEQVIRPERHFAVFGAVVPSDDARRLADWIADSNDAKGAEFVIIDKKLARLYVFDSSARLRSATPVLLGGAKGDDTVAGIGARPLDEVRPAERTTPAGRFVGERGRNARGEDVVWVDYDAAVSMHRVLTANPAERRLERLATPTSDDNRISYGCINIPVAFYETYIRPAFAARRGIVYVLPETKSLKQVFNSYDVARL